MIDHFTTYLATSLIQLPTYITSDSHSSSTKLQTLSTSVLLWKDDDTNVYPVSKPLESNPFSELNLRMDSLKNAVGLGENNQPPRGQEGQSNQPTEDGKGGGFLGGISDKLNSAAGGGPASEKNEDYLDKGMPA